MARETTHKTAYKQNYKTYKTMRKTFLLFAIALFIAGCSYKQKEQSTETRQTKAPTAAEIRNKQIQDSIKQARLDSLELIAWGDIKFGMNLKEVLRSQTFNGETSYRGKNSISLSYKQEKRLREIFGLKKLDSFWVHFQENQAAKIEIESFYLTANQISILVNDCDIFIENFTKKYGAPSYKKSEVNILEFTSGEEFKYAEFKVGDKTITIALGELDLEVDFYYKIYIENSNFPKRKKKELTEKEKKEMKERIKENEELKANSF